MKLRPVLAAIATFAPTAAIADPRDVTLYSDVSYVFRDGELSGCAATFDVLHQDNEYHHGNLVHVAGSLNYSAIRDAPYFILKLGLQDISAARSTFAGPAEGFLIEGDQTSKTNALPAMTGEQGFRMFPFEGRYPTATIAVTFADSGKLAFGYAMEPHGMLSVVTVDFRIANTDPDRAAAVTRAPDAPAKWLACVADATKLAVAKAKHGS